MPNNKTAAIYIRVSTEDQAEQGISIPAQKSRLMAYCQAQGWDVYDFYIDDGYSGKDLERPAMQRLLEDAAAKRYNTALVLKLDRLSRRQKDVLYLLEDVFDPAGIGFKSVTESFDTTTPFGKAALGMMAVFAQLERETIVERVRMAKKESARQGRFMGGPAPHGYRYNFGTKRLEIDELQAQTIQWIYDHYLEKEDGYQYTAESLNNKGVPGPRGEGWNKHTIHKILINPVYIGKVSHKGSLYDGKHKPIIDLDKWNEVQALVKYRGIYRSAIAYRSAGLLSGLIWCGECGARMRAKNTWQNYPCTEPKKVIRYYVCYSQDASIKHMVRTTERCRCGYKNADDIERKVIEKLYDFSVNPDLLLSTVIEVISKTTDKRAMLRGLNQSKKDFADIEKKINRWYEAFEKGALEPDELMERVKDLREKKNYLQSQVTEFEVKLKESDQKRANAKEMMELLQNFPVIWEESSPEERREMIANMIQAVMVFSDNRVEVEFNL